MLGHLRNPFSSITSSASSFASSSRTLLPPLSTRFPSLDRPQNRGLKQVLAPRKVKYRKSQKGLPISLPIGGSTRGTTIAWGQYGIRLLESARLSAAVLQSCREALRKKLKPVKGFKMYLRVFPDIPICVKGSEVRMGKGKGSFEYWACKVSAGKVVWEISAPGMPEQVAKAALKLVQVKLPVRSEIISSSSPPRLGTMASHDLIDLRKINLISAAELPPPPGTHYRIPSESLMSLGLSAPISPPEIEAIPIIREEVVYAADMENDRAAALALAEAMEGDIEEDALRV